MAAEFAPDEKTLVREEEGLADELTPSRKKIEPPYVVVVDGPRVGARFPLHQESPNIIGRAVGVTVRLEDQSVSRQHVEILKTPNGWTVKDLGSKNGTQVNGRIIPEAVVVGHKDLVKVGIYLVRMVLQAISLEDEMILPPEYLTVDRTVFAMAEPDMHTGSVLKSMDDIAKSAAQKNEEAAAETSLGNMKRKFTFLPQSKKRLGMLLGALLVCMIAGSVLLGRVLVKQPKTARTKFPPLEQPQELAGTNELPANPALPPISPEQAPADLPADPANPPPVALTDGAGGAVPPVAQTPQMPPGSLPPASGMTAPQQLAPLGPAGQLAKVPLFLDIASSPLSAEISFQGKVLGNTPLRANVELEPNQTFRVSAKFTLPELNESYTQELDFVADTQKSVIPLLFRAPIGLLRVDELPRDVQFYLEGTYSYDRFQAKSAKLNDIVLQKPIYVPYGTYVVELRRARKLGESSQTFVQDIIYHRDMTVASDNASYIMSIHEQDLTVFPVDVRSDPANADLFIDGNKVGKTPYQGVFPLGEHRLSLAKEGYFEHSETLKVDINTPYVTDIKLKTSLAGARINNAKAAMNRAMYPDAVNELAEALNQNPAPSEVALVNYLLGKCYLQTGDSTRAIAYFEKARASSEQHDVALLGLVNAYAAAGRVKESLPLLVEVLLKTQDEAVKTEAKQLFQKISPFRSVLYVYSEPAGATVTVNGKVVAQPTPVILHELPLGSYRLRVEKPGFLPTDLNLNLAINEFNPIIVKLQPIPQ